MKHSFDIRPWLKPVLTCVLGLILIFRPGSLTTSIAWAVGVLIALAGAGKLVGFFFDASRRNDFLQLCGGVILRYSRELNAFAIGEDNARHIGVNVKRVKLVILVAISVLIGVCVSIGGTIGFVGLVIPHMARMVAGPNHRRLLPATLFSGAVFLLLADLVARTLLRPVELSIGVVTSMIGAVAFVAIFYRSRKAR